MTIFRVVLVNESLPVASCTITQTTSVHTPPELHADPCLQTRDPVCRHGVFKLVRKKSVSVGIVPRKIEQVNARKYDKKATEKRNGIDRIGGVESLKQNE